MYIETDNCINKSIIIYLFIVVDVPMQDNKQGIVTIFVTEAAIKIFLKSNYAKQFSFCFRMFIKA